MAGFKKATKTDAKLRLGLFAPSGAGKTYTSLIFAKQIGGPIAYIDTENKSSTKYLGEPGIPDYDIADLTYHDEAGKYIAELVALIKEAEQSYSVIILDSLTHAWAACKDEVDAAAKRMKTANTYMAWREGSKLWSSVIEAILKCKAHIIVCARSKQDYIQEKDANGRTQYRKVGMAPELREGMEYELDVVCEMDQEHNLSVTKTRCRSVDGSVRKYPNGDWLAPVLEWLKGAPAEIDWQAEARKAYKDLPDKTLAAQIMSEHGTNYQTMTAALVAAKENA